MDLRVSALGHEDAFGGDSAIELLSAVVVYTRITRHLAYATTSSSSKLPPLLKGSPNDNVPAGPRGEKDDRLFLTTDGRGTSAVVAYQ